jgi:hypothetical protein
MLFEQLQSSVFWSWHRQAFQAITALIKKKMFRFFQQVVKKKLNKPGANTMTSEFTTTTPAL